MNKKNANIGVQTFFYIMMIMFMIAIIIFGLSKLLSTKELISEQDLAFVKKEVETALTYCEDPLNRGGSKKFEIKHKSFNTIMVLTKDPQNLKSDGTPNIGMRSLSTQEDLIKYLDAGENIILANSVFSGKTIESFVVIDSFLIDFDQENNVLFTNKYGEEESIQLNMICT